MEDGFLKFGFPTQIPKYFCVSERQRRNWRENVHRGGFMNSNAKE
jgi:hypothetical protein